MSEAQGRKVLLVVVLIVAIVIVGYEARPMEVKLKIEDEAVLKKRQQSTSNPVTRTQQPAAISKKKIEAVPADTKTDTSPENAEKYYEELYAKQLSYCGDLCSQSGGSMKRRAGTVLDVVTSDVNCKKLYETDIFDMPSVHVPPPRDVPNTLIDSYSLKGAVRIKNKYTFQKYSGETAMVHSWTEEYVNEFIKKAKTSTLDGNYGRPTALALAEAVEKANYKGKSVLVIGSENPWVEAIILERGASHVYTLEYGEINSTHPKITSYTPWQFNQMFREGRVPKIDGMVTFSSLEHSGLGRYGDTLNPWGDVIAVAKAACVLEKSATIVVGVECNSKFRDKLYYNLHREYGPTRWPHLLTNFEAIERIPLPRQCMFIAKSTTD